MDYSRLKWLVVHGLFKAEVVGGAWTFQGFGGWWCMDYLRLRWLVVHGLFKAEVVGGAWTLQG